MNELPKPRKRFGYRPALLVGRQFVEFGDTHLICTDGEGAEKWRLATADIDRLAFVEHRIRGTQMSRLDFLTKDRAARRSLGCSSTAVNPRSDPDYIAFRAIVSAVVDHLSTTRPDIPVTIGEYGRARTWIFLIGVVAMLFALGISIGALVGGRGDALAGEALVPVSALLLFGLYIAWTNVPWRPGPRVPVKLFAKVLSELNEDKAPSKH